MVSTHWVGYVHNIFKLYTAPYKTNIKKDRLLKKAPLEVRHNKGGSFLSASGFLCLLHTLVTLLLGMASVASLGVTVPVWHNGRVSTLVTAALRAKIKIKIKKMFELEQQVWKQAHRCSWGR